MNKVLVVAGEGGHMEQWRRLQKRLNLDNTIVTLLTDAKPSEAIYKIVDEVIVMPTIRTKNDVYIFSGLIAFCKVLWLVFHRDERKLISLGPGLAIPSAIAFRMKQKTVLHIETWSRHFTRSITGMAMYYLSHVFMVQNIDCRKLYKRAIFVGRL